MQTTPTASANDYGPRRLSVELTNICNLHCSYCLRDDDALYHTPANFFSIELLRRILRESREVAGITHLMLTGGEPTLHPRFREVLELAGLEGLKTSFVTNGWHFERVWPVLRTHPEVVTHVAFSMDGATREAHDRWRGEGSFVRLVRAITMCRMGGLPFSLKVGIRRDTLPQLEQLALFAARMGAESLFFDHVMPTSGVVENESALSLEERTQAEQEIALLAGIFKMRVGINVGYYYTEPTPPCSALAGVSFNVDYRGRLSLCCNMSGYRGAVGEADVVADLNEEGFASAHARLRLVAERQLGARREALARLSAEGRKPDLYTGSPCLFCLKTFGKIPWSASAGVGLSRRSLPVAMSQS